VKYVNNQWFYHGHLSCGPPFTVACHYSHVVKAPSKWRHSDGQNSDLAIDGAVVVCRIVIVHSVDKAGSDETLNQHQQSADAAPQPFEPNKEK
jgi:hypothetical protein